MAIFITFFLLVLGLALLVKGSDIFVDAASGLARNFKVSNLTIGLTVMAFGTSAPEAFIGIRSAIDGTTALAMGNVIGSDIFNLIFIIGFAAIITPMAINFKTIARDYFVAIFSPILLLVMMLIFDAEIPKLGAAVLLILFFIYVLAVVREVLKNRNEHFEIEKELNAFIQPLKRNIFFTILGLICILIGGEIAVYNAVVVAELLGMSPRIIGLSIVAIGTSLPELMIVITAARRGESELAVGNIIGSSIFNIMFVLGLTGLIAPLPIEVGLIYDLVFLLGASAVFCIFCLMRKKLTRLEGFVMIGMYVGYLASVILG